MRTRTALTCLAAACAALVLVAGGSPRGERFELAYPDLIGKRARVVTVEEDDRAAVEDQVTFVTDGAGVVVRPPVAIAGGPPKDVGRSAREVAAELTNTFGRDHVTIVPSRDAHLYDAVAVVADANGAVQDVVVPDRWKTSEQVRDERRVLTAFVGKKLEIVRPGAPATTDERTDRIRLFVNDQGRIDRMPVLG